jgi:hypothetical protein
MGAGPMPRRRSGKPCAGRRGEEPSQARGGWGSRTDRARRADPVARNRVRRGQTNRADRQFAFFSKY